MESLALTATLVGTAKMCPEIYRVYNKDKIEDVSRNYTIVSLVVSIMWLVYELSKTQPKLIYLVPIILGIGYECLILTKITPTS